MRFVTVAPDLRGAAVTSASEVPEPLTACMALALTPVEMSLNAVYSVGVERLPPLLSSNVSDAPYT